MPDVLADVLGFPRVQHDEVVAAVADGVRRRGLGFLVPPLAVNDRGVPAFGVPAHVLPDVQHRPARGVDERAAALLELLELGDRDTECREDHHVVGPGVIQAFRRLAQKADAHRPQLVVDVRVVNDLAGQEHAAFGKPLARLIRVVDGAVDAVAEPELARQMDREPAAAEREVVGLDGVDERAVVVVGQAPGDGLLQVEALAKNEGGHPSECRRCRGRAASARRSRAARGYADAPARDRGPRGTPPRRPPS